jgi:RNase H-fold protein (predicted Holliday junction resolvase)
MNDQMIYFHLGDIIQRYTVKTIVFGRPSKQLDIQERIQKFMKNLDYIIEGKEITIEKIEEDYTSVEAGDLVSQTFKDMQAFKKNAAEDTVSAMKILERRISAKA